MCSFMEIRDIYAREIMNSGGESTIEVEVLTEDGNVGKASVPAFPVNMNGNPISTADHEKRKEDSNDKNTQIAVNSSLWPAVENECLYINSAIADLLIGENVYDQLHIDRLLRNETDITKGSGENDGLRAGCAMGISMAVADAAAKSLGLPLFRYLGGIFSRTIPIPVIKILECHGCWSLFLIPSGFHNYSDGLRSCRDIFRRLALSAEMEQEKALMLVCDAISQAGYKPGEKIIVALEEKSGECYNIRRESDFDLGQQAEDTQGTAFSSKKRPAKETYDVGVRLRLDQEKTLTDFFKYLKQMQNRGCKTTLICDFEETEDAMIADIAVAAGVDQIMIGGLYGGERTAKYNRLLKIEDMLGPYAV